MSVQFALSPSPLYSHVSPPPSFHLSMPLRRRLNLHLTSNLRRHHHHHHHDRRLKCNSNRFSTFVTTASVKQETTVFTKAPVTTIIPAAESLYSITINVSDSPDIISSHTVPGQYLQLKVLNAEKPSFLAIASPPSFAAERGELEFLVKSVAGSPAEVLCGLKNGDFVELTPAMGRGFDIAQISPPETYQTVLIFATGSGISPIRSLIESGFGADRRCDVRLYYGARNLQRMAYQDRFESWESSGVKIVPVLSQPTDDNSWTGETGFVQAAFARAMNILSPSSTGAVLCGQKQMAEEITALLLDEGVSTEKILKNF